MNAWIIINFMSDFDWSDLDARLLRLLVAGSAAMFSIASGDTATLSGTTSLSGKVSGKGTLALAGGSTTIGTGASLPVATWTVSGSGTSVTLSENLTYAGTFSAGAGTTLNLSGGNLTLTGKDTFSGATTSGSHSLSQGNDNGLGAHDRRDDNVRQHRLSERERRRRDPGRRGR